MALGVDSASNRYKYQKSSWGKERPARKADNITAISEPIVYKLWKPRPLTTLWATTACYRDSFSFHLLLSLPKLLHVKEALISKKVGESGIVSPEGKVLIKSKDLSLWMAE
jgi:hypothetical protein